MAPCTEEVLEYKANMQSFVNFSPSGAFWLKKFSSSSLIASLPTVGIAVAVAVRTEAAEGAARNSPNGSLVSALLVMLLLCAALADTSEGVSLVH